MQITRSTKYNAKGEFWHDDRQILISRAWGGLSFEGVPKCLVVVGEEILYSQTYYYILVEAETAHNESIPDLVRIAKRIEHEYGVTRWLGRIDRNIEEILAICNKTGYNSGNGNLTVMDSPRLGEWIDESVSLVLNMVRSADKRLYFFGESGIPAELKALPAHNIKAEDYPRATALANAIGGLLRYGYEVVDSSMLEPDDEPDY